MESENKGDDEFEQSMSQVGSFEWMAPEVMNSFKYPLAWPFYDHFRDLISSSHRFIHKLTNYFADTAIQRIFSRWEWSSSRSSR